MPDVRVRFAPSPTGYLHVGGARTAIFNWLYARRHGGVFVLRIEDTDLARSQGPMTQAILDGMQWLGLAADEGPFYQAQERERHVADAARLIDQGKAYRCFCSAESIKEAREAARARGEGFRYPRTCRALSTNESMTRVEAGEPFAVRFAIPDGESIEWNDQVHGRTAIAAEQIDDFVLLRSDGSPTYMLSVVSDDVAMRISHVIRGDDHISNTPKQILLYRALGEPEPIFAHLPMILGEDKKRLSKRHGAVSVLDYRDRGILADAMFNFLSLLGWSPDDDSQILDRERLTSVFGLDGVGKSGAVFDTTKLEWMNGEYIRALSIDQLEPLVRPAFEAAESWRDEYASSGRKRFRRVLAMLQPRAKTLAAFPGQALRLLDPEDEFPYDAKAEKKQLKGDDLLPRLRAWRDRLAVLESWEPAALEQALRDLADELEVSAGKLIHPTRLALTGSPSGPGIFDVLEAVGREHTLSRLDRLLRHAENRPML